LYLALTSYGGPAEARHAITSNLKGVGGDSDEYDKIFEENFIALRVGTKFFEINRVNHSPPEAGVCESFRQTLENSISNFQVSCRIERLDVLDLPVAGVFL
jgi:hypothetical protein